MESLSKNSSEFSENKLIKDSDEQITNNSNNKVVDLATFEFKKNSKRFYLDLKQNNHGKFIKFSEASKGIIKGRIFMSMHTLTQFKDYLEKFITISNNLGKIIKQDTKWLHSESIINNKRRYYFDLLDNINGRFLYIAQTSKRKATRSLISIPNKCMKNLHQILVKLLIDFNDASLVDLPEKHIFIDNNKVFYFNPVQNKHGTFLKISELKSKDSFCSSITISASALSKFTSVLNEILLEITDGNKKIIKKNEL